MKRKPGASGVRRVSRQASKTAPKSRGGFLRLSAEDVAQRLVAQKERARIAAQKERAVSARDSFRVKKSDHGKFVMISTTGKRNPQARGRKGYLVYVTKTGKKQLAGYKHEYTPRKITDIEAPAHGNKLKAAKQFQAMRRVKVGGGRAAVKGRGALKVTGTNDFNEAVVEKISKSVKQTIERQASHRSFILSANVLVALPDGTTRAYNVLVPIARPDHVAIELGGVENFIRQKFYAFMARELAFDGYVSSGSANHIRRLKINKGKPVSEWRQGDGNKWRGNESTIVNIQHIEWEIQQAQ